MKKKKKVISVTSNFAKLVTRCSSCRSCRGSSTISEIG